MNFPEQLEKNLKISAKRHGAEKPLTIGHMANLVALTNRQLMSHLNRTETELLKIENEFWEEVGRYGNSDT